MSRGWDTYYIIFLAGAVGLVLPLGVSFLGWLLNPIKGRKKLMTSFMKGGARTRSRISERRENTRFFLAVNVGTVLIFLGFLLLPAVASIRGWVDLGDSTGVLKAVVAVGVLIGAMTMSLLYSVRKGDLSWLWSYRKPRDRR